MNPELYTRAQKAMAELKGIIRELLSEHPNGLINAEIGRALGIYGGHKRQEGHISRTLLEALHNEGIVTQDAKKIWRLRVNSDRSKNP